MAARASGRGRERGITSLALTTASGYEVPGPGTERKPQVGIAGAGSPTGAASRGRARFETVRCPLCGKAVRQSNIHDHAFSHFQRLEKAGVVRLARENGGWVVETAHTRYYGIGWRALCAVAEQLAKERVMNSG
jgi:hypothetical protein